MGGRISLRKVSGIDSWVLYEGGERTKWRMSLERGNFRTSDYWWKLWYGNRSLGSFESREECFSALRERYLEKRADLILEKRS